MTRSLMDNDLYKWLFHQVIFHRFMNVHGEYTHTCRNEDVVMPREFISETALRDRIMTLGEIGMTDEELRWMSSEGYFSPEYVEAMSYFRLNPQKFVTIDTTKKGFRIQAKGPMFAVQPFEILIVKTFNECYTEGWCEKNGVKLSDLYAAGHKRLMAKINYHRKMRTEHGGIFPSLMEFGTRRRANYDWHDHVIRTMVEGHFPGLVGTSNVHFGIKYGIPVKGTFGHEAMMMMQALCALQDSQREWLKIWLQEYHSEWGFPLTDTLGDDKFFKDFSKELARAYPGMRQDSGSPDELAYRAIDHYQGFGIDPMSKVVTFSNNLDFEEMWRLFLKFYRQIGTSFGIGTYITNDMGPEFYTVPQGVMKLTECQGQPVCKLSNDVGKVSCKSPEYASALQHAIACDLKFKKDPIWNTSQ